MSVGLLLDAIRAEIDSRIADNANGSLFWDAASTALAVLEGDREALDKLGEDGLREMLLLIQADVSQEAMLKYLKTANADQLIDALRAGTERVEEETHVIRERNAKILSIAETLGMVGARIILGLL